MIALGSNVHIFARPHRRRELAQCFETVLGSPVRTVEFLGIDQPMLIVSFPGGGHLSIEFTDDTPDDEQPRLGHRQGAGHVRLIQVRVGARAGQERGDLDMMAADLRRDVPPEVPPRPPSPHRA